METVIYGDVLLAVNFIINLMVLGLTRKLTGIPVRRWRRYLGALAGALCSFVIFLPAGGVFYEAALRLGATAVVIGVTYGGQPIGNLLRLSAVFFGVGFLLAGFVMGLWMVLPENLFAVRNGIVYFQTTPLILLGCVTCAYLFVTLFDRIFDGGQGRAHIWQGLLERDGNAVAVQLFMDTGNQLVEPFSGLPVAVIGLQSILPLLRAEERQYIATGQGTMPPGLRAVFYNGVGVEGLLCALRPDAIRLTSGGRSVCCEGYLAVTPQALSCHGCSGIFNPRLVGIGVATRQTSY